CPIDSCWRPAASSPWPQDQSARLPDSPGFACARIAYKAGRSNGARTGVGPPSTTERLVQPTMAQANGGLKSKRTTQRELPRRFPQKGKSTEASATVLSERVFVARSR